MEEAAASCGKEAARRGAEEEVERDVLFGLEVARQVGEPLRVGEHGHDFGVVDELGEAVCEPGEQVDAPFAAAGEGVHHVWLV